LLDTKSATPSQVHRQKQQDSETYVRLRTQRDRLASLLRKHDRLRHREGEDAPSVLRSIWAVHAEALAFERDLLRAKWGYRLLVIADLTAPVEKLPYPTLCACGCGRGIRFKTRGRLPRFALPSCRTRAHRRRRVGLPEFAPKVQPGGRLALAERLDEWMRSRRNRASLLVHDISLVRDTLRGDGLSSTEIRALLKHWRREL
jgi:hypothetical protein